MATEYGRYTIGVETNHSDSNADPSATSGEASIFVSGSGTAAKFYQVDGNGDKGTVLTTNLVSGDATMSAAGALTIANDAVESGMLNDNVISGQSALGSAAVAQGDELLFSDGGTVKKVTFSNFEDSIFGNVSGDATIAAGGALTIAAQAVENSMLADDAVGADELAANAVVEASIVDNAVTLAKMAGLARGKFIYGDASGDPAALAAGANGKILVADANGDPSWTTLSGDATLSAGAITIAAGAVEGSMLADDCISAQSNLGGTGVADADEFMLSDGGTLKALTGANLYGWVFSKVSGDATVAAGGGLTIANDAVENAMIADNAVDDTHIRLRNNQALNSRNAADDGDVDMIKVLSNNGVQVGAGGSATFILNAPTPFVTASNPAFYLSSSQMSNSNGHRYSTFGFKGTKADGENCTMVQLQGAHYGTGDDFKGQFAIKVNDGDDAASGLGTAFHIDADKKSTFYGDVVMGGTTPSLTIGDAGAEDTMLVFDGNAQDYRIGLDDGTDVLEFGVGSAHGTTTSLKMDSSLNVDVAGHNGSVGLKLGGTLVSATAAELNYVDIATLGTAAASKALTIKGDSTWTVAGMTCADIGTITTADINGGNIDGTTIGATGVAAGSFAAVVGTTGTYSGILKTDDTTEATSTTDGSLQTDGGLSVVKSAVIGDDLDLLSDAAIMSFGAGKDVTFTHDGGTGMDIVSAGALDVSSTGGSATFTVADGQTLTLGKSGASALLLSPHGTAGSELASLTNTAGTTDGTDGAGAILLDAQAGGIGLAWADAKDLWAEGGRFVVTANEDAADAIKLHADAGTSQTITLVNDAGTSVTEGSAAIQLTATAGGINIKGNKDAADAILLTSDGGTSGAIKVHNDQGTAATSIELISDAGGVSILAGNTTHGVKIATGTSGVPVTIGHGTSEVTVADNLTVSGNLTVTGTTITDSVEVISTSSGVLFEGGTDDGHEGTLISAVAGADVTYTLPNLTGHIPLLAGAASNANVTAAEFHLLDGGSSVATVTVADGDGVLFNDAGTMKQVTVQSLAAYFDDEITAMPNLVTVGTIGSGVWNAGAVTSSGRIVSDNNTEATSTTDGSIQTDGGISSAKSIVCGDDLDLLSDGAILNFGANQDVSLTHVHDDGLLLNSSRELQFGDNGTFICQSSDGILKVEADSSIALTAPDVLISSSTSDKPQLELRCTNADANPGTLLFRHDSASPADDDELGEIVFNGDDDGGNDTMFAKIACFASDVSNGSEDGALEFKYRGAGAIKEWTLGDGAGLVGPNDSTYGTVKAHSFVTYSDESLKTDFKALDNPLEMVKKLNGLNYTWKSDGSKDIGFIAQEVEKVVPEVVYSTNGKAGSYGLDYSSLTALLTEAIKQQDSEITALKATLAKVLAKLDK